MRYSKGELDELRRVSGWPEWLQGRRFFAAEPKQAISPRDGDVPQLDPLLE